MLKCVYVYIYLYICICMDMHADLDQSSISPESVVLTKRVQVSCKAYQDDQPNEGLRNSWTGRVCLMFDIYHAKIELQFEYDWTCLNYGTSGENSCMHPLFEQTQLVSIMGNMYKFWCWRFANVFGKVCIYIDIYKHKTSGLGKSHEGQTLDQFSHPLAVHHCAKGFL